MIRAAPDDDDADDVPWLMMPLRWTWLVAKKSAVIELNATAEMARRCNPEQLIGWSQGLGEVREFRLVPRLEEARDAIIRYDFAAGGPEFAVALGPELVSAHYGVTILKKDCISMGLVDIYQAIKSALIAIQDAIACCVVCETGIGGQVTYRRKMIFAAAIDGAYEPYRMEACHNDLRASLIKSYCKVFAATW